MKSPKDQPMFKRKSPRSLSVIVLVTAVCLFIAGLASNRAVAQAPDQEKTVEQVYKNIQVLTGLPASELDGAMYFMAASLGTGCTYCHVNPWESDQKPAKLITRKMIEMTRRLNKENFSGNSVVNCYTCHRGHTQTVTIPPVVRDTWPPESAATTAQPAEGLPSADQVIDKYIRAIGGEAAIEKLKSIMWRGQITTMNRMGPPQTVTVEVIQAAPDKRLITLNTPNGTATMGYDGTSGWMKDPRGKRTISGEALARNRIGAEAFWYLKIKDNYPALRVLGKEKINDRDAYVVGATSKSDSREKLYFDAETGLLIRRYITFKTALGSIPEVTDLTDYKDVGGIKLPFTISWSRPPFSSVWKATETKTNVPADDKQFTLPPDK